MEGEFSVNIFPAKIATSEETPGVRISSRVKFQTKQDYIPSMQGKKYETDNTQVECEDTFHPDSNMFICQQLIEELTDVASFIMAQLSFKAGMKSWNIKGLETAKYDTKQLHFRDTFKRKAKKRYKRRSEDDFTGVSHISQGKYRWYNQS